MLDCYSAYWNTQKIITDSKHNRNCVYDFLLGVCRYSAKTNSSYLTMEQESFSATMINIGSQ